MVAVLSAVDAVRDAIRRHPWWTDSLLALFLTFISLGSVIFAGTARHPRTISPLDAILVPITSLPIAARRYRPLTVLAITVSAETVLLLFSSRAQVPFGVGVALYTVASRCTRPVAARAAAWVALPITVGVVVNDWSHPGQVIPKLALFAITWLVGDNLRTRRAYLTELEARAARLEREREEQATRATLEERARIARELHDVIAHNVSVMVVQASAGEDVFDSDPGRAREAGRRRIDRPGRAERTSPLTRCDPPG